MYKWNRDYDIYTTLFFSNGVYIVTINTKWKILN